MSNIGKIIELARELSLGNIARRANRYLDTATEDELMYLEHILAEEVFLRNERKRVTIGEKARLPKDKNFTNFDIGLQPKVQPYHINKYKGEEWINDGFNVLIIGKAGVGKTHFASAIGYAAADNKRKVFYTTLKELLFYIVTQNKLVKSKNKLSYIRECDVLIMDEFGYVPVSKEEGLELYNFMNDINKHTSMVIAANRPVENWANIFGDEILATTVADRYLEKCQIIRLTGNSYRLTKSKGFI